MQPFPDQMMPLEEVLIAPPLRIRYLAGQGTRLVLSLSGVGTQRHVEPPPEFFRMVAGSGQHHVAFISDESRSWLNGPGLAEKIVETVALLAHRIGASEIVALGNSMGGTMALHLSRLIDMARVIAFVPQYSVDGDVVPEETRWAFFRKKIAAYPFRSVDVFPSDRTQITILHGATDDELAHALRFPADEAVDHYIFPGRDHNLARTLRDNGQLAEIVDHALEGRRWRLRQAVKAAGGLGRQNFAQLPMDQRSKVI